MGARMHLYPLVRLAALPLILLLAPVGAAQRAAPLNNVTVRRVDGWSESAAAMPGDWLYVGLPDGIKVTYVFCYRGGAELRFQRPGRRVFFSEDGGTTRLTPMPRAICLW